ncbi:hypothetical protein MKX75_06015 [Paenibacillus sp. FSL R5-0341]|uniref:hypothetical protein n=1 Tax=Paenibacillus sp. FSL R5-0341 TaxID=2921636 RepID=UPI0030CD4CF5
MEPTIWNKNEEHLPKLAGACFMDVIILFRLKPTINRRRDNYIQAYFIPITISTSGQRR